MRITEYDERYARKELIDPEAFWLDGKALELIAYPLIVDVEPGETVDTGLPGESMTAPKRKGSYELWHYVCGGSHSRFEWREVPMIL